MEGLAGMNHRDVCYSMRNEVQEIPAFAGMTLIEETSSRNFRRKYPGSLNNNLRTLFKPVHGIAPSPAVRWPVVQA